MKKLLLLIILPVFAFSAIDECKTDVYFANGILTDRETARDYAEDVLKPAIIEKLLVPIVLDRHAYIHSAIFLDTYTIPAIVNLNSYVILILASTRSKTRKKNVYLS